MKYLKVFQNFMDKKSCDLKYANLQTKEIHFNADELHIFTMFSRRYDPLNSYHII